jgi:hypothetical protein
MTSAAAVQSLILMYGIMCENGVDIRLLSRRVHRIGGIKKTFSARIYVQMQS